MTTTHGALSLFAALALGIGCALSPTSAAAEGSTDTPTSQYTGKLNMVGLTADQRLVSFSDKAPGSARSIGYVTGLSGDQGLIGIDYRVQNGKLYGVGDAGGIYVLNPHTAAAIKVSQLTVALQGDVTFGVDFNPAADRLRVVSDTGQNLRHDVNPGGTTIVDGTLSYAAGTTATGIAGAAYTNNDLHAASATTLFDIDYIQNQVAIQAPANAGNLSPTGKLWLDAKFPVGFDIYSTIRKGLTVQNDAYAAMRSNDGVTRLYGVNLLTGKAAALGAFAAEDAPEDIAIKLNQR